MPTRISVWFSIYKRNQKLQGTAYDKGCHCCVPALSILVMLVSRNIFHVVSVLQPIVSLYMKDEDVAQCCSRFFRFVERCCSWACGLVRFSISNVATRRNRLAKRAQNVAPNNVGMCCLSPGQTIATYPNTVGRNMLRIIGHPVTTYWELLVYSNIIAPAFASCGQTIATFPHCVQIATLLGAKCFGHRVATCRDILSIENRTSAHAQAQDCCTNLAKRGQTSSTSCNID